MNVLKKLNQEFNINFTQKQTQAIKHFNGPACVIAVPGSGKTTVIVTRIGYLIFEKKVYPENILVLTFSKASAIDMKNRFFDFFNNSMVDFTTIHSFAYRIVRNFYKDNNLTYNVIEDGNSKINKISLLKEIYYEVNNEIITEDQVEELLTNISFVKNRMLSDIEIKEYRSRIDNFHIIYSKYEDFKTENKYIDFDDMLQIAYDILKENYKILNYYKKQYKYILLDEGQDTSKLQHEIIKLLAYPENNLFVVADDDQSIYQWRGAYPDEILNFNKNYNNAKIIFMDKNFRSSKDIVEVCSNFIQKNKNRYVKDLHTDNISYKPIQIVRLKNDDEQIQYIINQLKQLQCEEQKDTAILYRNNISAIGLVDMLVRENIPFYMKDTKMRFFNHWIIQDIFSFINLSYNNKDLDSFSRIWYKTKTYITKELYDYVESQNNLNKSIFKIMIDFPYFKNDYEKENIIRLEHDFRILSRKPPIKAIEFIEEDLGYKKYLKYASKNYGLSFENAKMIITNLKYIAKSCNTKQDIINRMCYLEESIKKSYNNQNKCVNLMTIHSSKGLEFENVFMMDLIDGEFPNYTSIEEYSQGKPRNLEEERRLFYVGMTRAKKNLQLITVSIKNNDRVNESMFVKEVNYIINPNNPASIFAYLKNKKWDNKTTSLTTKSSTLKQKKHSEKTTNTKHVDIKLGDKINHKKYGIGYVVAINGNKTKVEFETKTCVLDIDICAKKNLVQKIIT